MGRHAGSDSAVDGGRSDDGKGALGDASALVSFSTNVMPLIGHCGATGCHGGTVPSWPYDALVNQPATECVGTARMIVVPGDATTSYLLNKLEGSDMCTGVQMPANAPPLSGSDIELIATWIAQGALDN